MEVHIIGIDYWREKDWRGDMLGFRNRKKLKLCGCMPQAEFYEILFTFSSAEREVLYRYWEEAMGGDIPMDLLVAEDYFYVFYQREPFSSFVEMVEEEMEMELEDAAGTPLEKEVRGKWAYILAPLKPELLYRQ